MVGFPSTGVVRMFVERSRGQVGISMGPFVGNMMAEHTFSIQDMLEYVLAHRIHKLVIIPGVI